MTTHADRQHDGGIEDAGRRPGRRALLAGMTGAGALAGGIALGTRTASAAPAAVTAGPADYVVDVIANGADATGRTPSDDAFRKAALQLLGGAPKTGYSPKKVLLVPPGTYLLTQPDSLLPITHGTDNPGVIDGISISGYGKRLSRIVYAPTTPNTVFWTNDDRYKNIRFSGLTFEGRDATATFNLALSSKGKGVQDTWYTDVEWHGTWKAGIVLDGPAGTSNLNSEMGWDHCQISGSYADAFLVMGGKPAEGQQDQFLNYWFRDCKVEFQSGIFVRNERGGSMNFIGGSYILVDEESTGTFFKLNANSPRNDSVMRLYAQGIRFEVRGKDHKVIDSAWYKGTITFVSCDDTANSFKPFAPGATPHVYRFNAVNPSRGPMIRYQDCALLGSHHVTTATVTTAGKVLYDGCRFADMTTAATALRWTGPTPWYEFRDCLGEGVRIPDVKAAQ
ncbi:hypothetical protein RMN57_02455 [Kitasatospora sp. CM 4170]|uniref:Pectate lyase superfamily protein domain-containing protein n=1 Tax=Kitasatospora aburaviensis TaxID=67265 RepID=A0ABW1ETV4_9ACTN|nr:hypothetical protein [Kitasatospora sp. CM 4170]WNM43641.1 hypothetical protein RMN57_02455 [Kitasatospora sp. CM 4170]